MANYTPAWGRSQGAQADVKAKRDTEKWVKGLMCTEDSTQIDLQGVESLTGTRCLDANSAQIIGWSLGYVDRSLGHEKWE